MNDLPGLVSCKLSQLTGFPEGKIKNNPIPTAMQQEQTVKNEQIGSDRQQRERESYLSRVAACLSRIRRKKPGQGLSAATVKQMQSTEVMVT